MLRVLALVVCASMLVACRAGSPVAGPTADPQSSGVAPSRIVPSNSPSGSAAPTTDATPTGGATTAAPTGSPRSFHTVGRILDASGDGGAQAKPYEDILGIVIQDDGDSARILVRLGAAIPDPLPEGEQMGVGVDLYRTAGQLESDYQVFAAGDENGWEAFFSDPRGPARFPGTWGLDGDVIQFDLPWSAFGSMPLGEFSGFIDWDRDSLAVNLAGGDRAPDQGRASFAR